MLASLAFLSTGHEHTLDSKCSSWNPARTSFFKDENVQVKKNESSSVCLYFCGFFALSAAIHYS